MGIALIGVSAATGALTFSAPVLISGNEAGACFSSYAIGGFDNNPDIAAPQTGAVITPEGGPWCSEGEVAAFLPNPAGGVNPFGVQAADGVTPVLFGSVVVGP